jgi:hypothetical protein
MIRRHRTLRPLLVGVLAASVLGCASSSLSLQSLGPGDLTSLAGTWEGTASGLEGLSVVSRRQITLTISADGAFAASGGAYTTRGTARIKDGGLFLASGFQSPEQAPQQVATATLSELKEQGQVRQLLWASGFRNATSFSFMVSRPKP